MKRLSTASIACFIVASISAVWWSPARAAAEFAINSLAAAPVNVVPGRTVAFTVTMTAASNAANYPVEFSWGRSSAHQNSHAVLWVTFTAGVPITKVYSWVVPAGTAPGSYTLGVGIYDPAWNVPSEAYASTKFAVTGIGTNGACGAANGGDFASVPSANLCSAGTASTIAGNGSPWTWSCYGADGGTTASCAADQVINGAAGSAKNQDFLSLTSQSANLCASGTVSGFAATSTGWSWTCQGSNGGISDKSGIAFQVRAGVCGASNNVDTTSTPATGLCSVGSASLVTGAGPWSWSCAGAYGGATAYCQAYLEINGSCGAANGMLALQAPSAALCATGVASSVLGSGPWQWSCAGDNGGTSAQCFAPVQQAGTPETPGLSPALSAAPPYQCTTNYYVDATNGSDSNPGTRSLPWKTIGNANNGWPNVPVPGECVNVLPGDYTIDQGMVFSVGGNANTPTGYVVYRSTVPQRAHIIANFTSGDVIALWAPYIIIDGFEVDGNNVMTSGHGIDGCTCGGQSCNIAHHSILINNIVHDMGGAGLSSCTADYVTWKHNIVYNTSSTNPWEVSGIDLWQPKALAPGSFTPTAADTAPYGIVIAYNIVHNNSEGNNGHATHSDGNGIIIDTTLGSSTCQTCGTPYPGQILVVGNLSYNNGGGGVHVFLSQNVTVANNTAYNNYLDPLNPGSARGELSNGGSTNVTWMNNIAYAVPGSGTLAANAPIVTWPISGFPDSGTWTANLTFGAPLATDSGNIVNPQTNMIGVNPLFNDPASGNFTLLPGSPAIAAGVSEPYLTVAPPDIGAY